jgi:hypothetical protein
MAAEREIRAIGGSYYLNDRKTAVQRTINMYPMLVEGLGEDSPLVLESVPGLSLVSDMGASIRGIYNADGRMFLAVGGLLKEMSTAETFTDRGALQSASGYVSMVNGTNQLAMVDGANLSVLNLDSNTIAAVTVAGWRGSKQVEFIDGFFIFVSPATEQFYITAIDNATVLNALDFSSADSQPDLIVAQISRKRELYLFGTRSCEVWIDSGAQAFPFVRYQGTPIDVGLVGGRAVTRAADTLVWVGQTERGGPYVYKMVGFQPVRISHQSVEQQLAAADYTNATVWTYQEAGAEFVCINAPGMPTTWCWDASTEQWHERGELSVGAWAPFRVEHQAYFNGAHYVAAGTKLYKLSRSYHDLAGDALVRERTWPHLVTPSLEPRSYHGLELRCTTGDAVTGSITLEISNDGGSVFGAPLQRSLGAVGRRQQRVRWLALGTCAGGGSRVHRLRCSDAVALTIQGATLS